MITSNETASGCRYLTSNPPSPDLTQLDQPLSGLGKGEEWNRFTLSEGHSPLLFSHHSSPIIIYYYYYYKSSSQNGIFSPHLPFYAAGCSFFFPRTFCSFKSFPICFLLFQTCIFIARGSSFFPQIPHLCDFHSRTDNSTRKGQSSSGSLRRRSARQGCKYMATRRTHQVCCGSTTAFCCCYCFWYHHHGPDYSRQNWEKTARQSLLRFNQLAQFPTNSLANQRNDPCHRLLRFFMSELRRQSPAAGSPPPPGASSCKRSLRGAFGTFLSGSTASGRTPNSALQRLDATSTTSETFRITIGIDYFYTHTPT